MNSAADPRACRSLWRRVLARAVLDLCGAGRIHSAELRAAELWVGDWPSPAFREVCGLAGVDADRAHAALKRLMPLSPRRRAAEIRARRQASAVPEMPDAA